ncbi:malate dehydrogenase 1B [Brachionus plicatilis]|uniref:Malate dehydrogenase 1B n=1 Tax=Brachionus plicatilis TaxID=10195 RepID=A0A3M7SEU8_BRAPC|nr:malate dehydrogenase 1B [Brachionus plicatilis]
MAKFVIAGKANCPHFAKAELLGDELTLNLPGFRVHKIPVDPNQWDTWLQNLCQKNNWKHSKSPIIWRELLDRGGKGILLGDANAFQEYALNYYGVKSELTSNDLTKIGSENENTFQIVEQEHKQVLASINPFNLTISNPESPALYYIINEILNENLFSKDVFIRLYTKNRTKNIDGISMEIEDLASPHLRSIKVVQDPAEAFKECDFAIILDELDESIGKDEETNLEKFNNPYISLAKDIDQNAKPTCKILISPFGSRNETCALVNLVSKCLKRINPKKYLIGNSMCDEMTAKAVLAHRLRINPAYVSNVIVMGQNISDSFYLDLTYARVTDFDGAVWAKTGTHWLNLISMVADKQWINKDFMGLVLDRENSVSQMLSRKSILVFAQSIVKLIKLWNLSHKNDTSLYSAIVYAKGNYGINEDIFLSIPVKFENGSYFCIKNFKISDQTGSVLEEITADTITRISKKFIEDYYVKNGYDVKLVTPKVVY